ncbi:hypothetical protein [Bacillus sp. EB600]|uniref:hypothetical protein n=1 Tax=Bacillus sp. EB600 TaxID=2806345 RepID=UPI00210ADCA8|nr:hypothetical protein [Bacillus sp. EB600]MCQ6278367.1 hypothetical protein [Bacillus sp. EB600]
MTKSEPKRPSALLYDEKGTSVVNEQIQNVYNSGSINKQGLHADLYGPKGTETKM